MPPLLLRPKAPPRRDLRLLHLGSNTRGVSAGARLSAITTARQVSRPYEAWRRPPSRADGISTPCRARRHRPDAPRPCRPARRRTSRARCRSGRSGPGTSFSLSSTLSTPSGSSTTPCSSEHFTYFTSSRPKITGRPESTDCALSPASTMALSGLRVAHDRGQDEQRVLPLALVDALAVLVEDAAIVRVHEGVGAALELVVDAGGRSRNSRTAGPAAADDVALQPLGLQRVDRVLHLRDGKRDLGLAVLVVVHVLHRALVGLDAA